MSISEYLSQYTFYQLSLMFFIYAFVGWCAEVAFAVVTTGKFVNRGFLNGPVCPIYGFGVVTVIIVLTPLIDNLAILFFGSLLLTSAIEFVTGWVLEKIFHAKWWDYSENRFNIKGYVCLEFSILWGLAATFVMKIIHPIIYSAILKFPVLPGSILLGVFYFVISADLAATIVTILHLKRRLSLLTRLAGEIHDISDKLGDSISDTVSGVVELSGKAREVYDDYSALSKQHRAEEKELHDAHRAEEKALYDAHRAEESDLLAEKKAEGMFIFEERKAETLDRAEEKRQELLTKLSERRPLHNRILSAFPSLKVPNYQDALNRLRSMRK